MMPPIMAAGMVVTDVPPDWSASGPVVTLSVAKCVLILIDAVNSRKGSAGDHIHVHQHLNFEWILVMHV